VSPNPVGTVGEDAAKLLSDAVVKVTAQAIKPALEPFGKELADVASMLARRAEELGEMATDQEDLLRQVEGHFTRLEDHFTAVLRAFASQLQADAGPQAAVDEVLKAVRQADADVANAASTAAAKQQATAPTLSLSDEPDEPAAWHELEAAISDALWRYAETVAGFHRDAAGLSSDVGRMHLARLAAARRARQVLRSAEDSAATDAIEHHATYQMLADAAGITRQTASKRYRPR
jgi:hypothetical protein